MKTWRSDMETLLPEMMAQTGIDMWLMTTREYNEDPVIKTMLPGRVAERPASHYAHVLL